MILFAIIAGLCLIAALFILADMLRFRKAQKVAEKPEALGVDAGGVLFIRGGKTYYKMPKGTDRKIADFPMDLRPGSVDMNRFTRILDEARKAHDADVAESKAEADKNMREVAREVTK